MRLRSSLAPFQRPLLHRSLGQLASTLILYGGAWGGVALLLPRSPWIALLLAPLAAGLLVRLFILQHDCGHGSFLPRRWQNELLGSALGVLTLAPYHYWRRTHAVHHGNVGNLDTRGELGYLKLLTVGEYRARTPAGRLAYRLYRNPLLLIGFGLPFQFLLWHRAPLDTPRAWRAEWASVVGTDVALLGLGALLAHVLGLWTFLCTEALVCGLASMAGGALFYVQHNFEGAWLCEGADWDPERAALQGSSRLELPALLAWFSGDIGLHHVHHASDRIPNYRLREAQAATPELQAVPRLGSQGVLRAMRLALYDEEAGRLVSFAEVGA